MGEKKQCWGEEGEEERRERRERREGEGTVGVKRGKRRAEFSFFFTLFVMKSGPHIILYFETNPPPQRGHLPPFSPSGQRLRQMVLYVRS